MSSEGKPVNTDVIILNRMYVGDYLGENIGHEVINLMKPDEDDDYYIYINSDGALSNEFITRDWRAKTILLTRWCKFEYKDKNCQNNKTLSCLEVLGEIGSTNINDGKYIKPWSLEETIKEQNEFIKNTIKADYINFNDKFHDEITYNENGVISDVFELEDYYNVILDKLQEIYKKDNTPLKVCSINGIEKSKEEEKKRLEAEDKDQTGKYKIINKERHVCTKEDIENYKKYLRGKEEYYIKPLQKLKHKLQVISIENVKYGNQSLEKIFEKNAGNDRALYVTFTAKDVKMIKPGNHIYLVNNSAWKNVEALNEKNDDNQGKVKVINVNLNKNNEVVSKKINFASMSLRQYIESNKYSESYTNILKQLADLDDYWEQTRPLTFEERKKLDQNNPHYIDTNPDKANFIAIIKKNYDELVYSNLFYYIFQKLPDLFIEFIKQYCKLNIPKNYASYTVIREEGNIDLLVDIRDKDGNIYLITIENKIKSGINGIRHDETGKEVGNQLSKYIHYAHGYRVSKGSDKTEYEYEKFDDEELLIKPYNSEKCKRAFFIFAPSYKNFNDTEINKNMHENAYFVEKEFEKDNYKLITYKEIYEFFKDQQNVNIPYFKEFLYAIKEHMYESDNLQERQMFERFAQRIEELKEQEVKNQKIQEADKSN